MIKKILLFSLAAFALLPLQAQDSLVPDIFRDKIKTHTKTRVSANKIFFAIRTNLLLPLLNAGLEIPLSQRLSIASDVYYPWLGYDKANVRCTQAALADAQLRLWLGPEDVSALNGNTMTGPALSLGAISGKYDFERKMKGFQGEIYGLYIDYSYTIRLDGFFRLSLFLGVGAASIPYRTYTVFAEGGKLIRDDSGFDIEKKWYGPVHGGVTLSFPIMSIIAGYE